MVSVKELYVRYGSDMPWALNGFNLEAPVKSRTALIGANGAGKSTLFLALTGIIDKSEGIVIIDNITLEKRALAQIRQKTGLIFQNPDDQLFMPTVQEDVAFGPRNLRLAEDSVEGLVNDSLARLDITRLKNRFTHRLSGGEKRLVALAGVLAMSPTVMLMDEPSSFLDPGARRNLINILNQLDQTIIIATHDLDFALLTCNTVVLLKEGRVFTEGKAREVLLNEKTLKKCGLELPLSAKI